MKPAELIAHVKGFKSPSKQQQLLLLLHDKKDRTKDDDKKYEAILNAELATRKAMLARSKVTAILRSEEKALAAEKRKARNHRLILQGTLIDLAGLEEKTRGEILGALLAASTVADPTKWATWKQAGDKLLAEKEANGHE